VTVISNLGIMNGRNAEWAVIENEWAVMVNNNYKQSSEYLLFTKSYMSGTTLEF